MKPIVFYLNLFKFFFGLSQLNISKDMDIFETYEIVFLAISMTHYSHVRQKNDEELYQINYKYVVFSNDNHFVKPRYTLQTLF